MTNVDQEKLIQMVLAELERQSESKGQDQCSKPALKKVLAIFSGGHIGLDDALKQMQIMQREGYIFEAVLTPNGKTVIGKQPILESLGQIPVYDSEDLNKLMPMLRDNEAVIVPVMTMNTAAKVINGIADNLATTLIMISLLSGKPVIAARDACNLRHLHREGMGHNKAAQAYSALLDSNIERLKDYGVKLCEVVGLADTVQQYLGRMTKFMSIEKENQMMFEKRILSINDLPNTSGTIRISPSTIVTPAAKDVIKERGIEIIVC